MILVDSNVLIDVISGDKNWLEWSMTEIATRQMMDQLIVNQVVVAEVGPRFASAEEFIDYASNMGIDYRDLDQDAAFVAGQAFVSYRNNRGEGASKLALPDFFIGGHAATCGASILTRDPRFYRIYFPEVSLITPSKDNHD